MSILMLLYLDNIKLTLFTKYYSKLVKVLPIKSLSAYFVSKQLIDFEDEEKIQSIHGQCKAARIALRKIYEALKAGQTKSFDELLFIMERYGGLSSVELVNEIRSKTNQ